MKETRKIVLTGLFIAMGILLPIIIHIVPDGGKILLPMHIPIILCGLCIGAKYGLVCGLITPFLSSVFTGMPNAAMLPGMMCELALYGLICGILMSKIKLRFLLLRIYGAIIPAMICGRIASGIINTFILGNGSQTLWAYLTTSVLTGAPGIILQLTLIPILMGILIRASIIDLKRT